jgi:3-methyladenine DNA glycosylase/8-oxoguanine DNA glycosylase
VADVIAGHLLIFPRGVASLASALVPTTRRARSFPAAARALAERDPVIARLHAAVGPPDIRPPQRTPFEALARAICFQQLSGKAAATIYGRFEQAVGGTVAPHAVLETPLEELRGAGLSAAKAASVLDLSEKVVDGTVPLEDAGLHRLPDDELVERLVVVRGIGRWTAEMFLLFQLRRLDVWPVDDLGVRKGFAMAWELAAMPAPKALAELGEPFRPYRSVVAWYCWRATELTGVLPA